jgi:hypothetical protein
MSFTVVAMKITPFKDVMPFSQWIIYDVLEACVASRTSVLIYQFTITSQKVSNPYACIAVVFLLSLIPFYLSCFGD